MSSQLIEQQEVPSKKISYYIATHLQVRQSIGKALIVSHQPENLLSTVRKQWMKGLKIMQTERASTLNKVLRTELDEELQDMLRVRFGVVSRLGGAWADITFARPQEVAQLPPDCMTIYLCAAAAECGHFLATAQANCVVIIYQLQ